ncbi:MAG TPA: helical backbone metal receptor [bacterium]|nr:helical backbone metal receptor [bacterium]
MVKKGYRAFLVTAAVAAALAACGKPAPRRVTEETRSFRDDLGRDVDVPVAPRRIICTSPEMTEILFALGAGGRVVGVVRGCDWPPAARELPSVGDFSNVSLERVAALEPNLVIAAGHEQNRIVAQLERLGVPTVAFLAPDIASVRRNVKAVGAIVGEEAKAAELVAAFDEKISAITSEAEKVPLGDRPRVYLEICPEPLMTVAEGSFVRDAIVLAGGVNVGAGLPRPYSRIEAEVVIARDPEVIVLCHGGTTAADVAARTGWGQITAVREKKICELNPDLILRAGPRLAEGVAALYRIFYPERAEGEGIGES